MRARAEVGQAFQYALIIFTLTVLLGLANALQVFGALDRDTLLTHLHSGTLGWITMGVFGITIWMFARRNEDLTAAIMLSGLGTAAYVMSFWSGVFILRGVFGLAQLAIIVYWWWFVYTRVTADGGIGRLDIPKLSVLLGLTTLVIGSTLGVIVQVLLATGNALPTGTDLVGAHASAQTGGYLVLVAAGFAEWQLIGGSGRPTLGLAQVYLLFVGGLVLSASLLLSTSLPAAAAQALPGLATLLTLAGILIAAYPYRTRRARRTVDGADGHAPHRDRRPVPGPRGHPSGDPRAAVHRGAGRLHASSRSVSSTRSIMRSSWAS